MTTLLLAFCVMPILAQPEHPTAEEKEKARQEEVRRQQALKDRDLKAENWPDGELAALKAMAPADIVKMEIFAIDWPQRMIAPGRKDLYKKVSSTFHFGTERRDELEVVLALIEQAPKYSLPAGVALEPMPPDRALVVQPVKGEPFEFLYSSALREPFAGVYSRELKEALYALSENTTGFSVIQLDGGKVTRTLNEWTCPPHRGGVASQILAVALHLSPEKGLTMSLKLRDEKGNILLESEQPVHYGEATVFPSPGPGEFVVLLQKP